MSGKPIYLLRLVPLILVMLLVWPPTVLVQEKKTSPTAQSPDEKEKTLGDLAREAIAKERAKKGLDPLDKFFSERNAREEQAKQEALAKATCQNLPDFSEMIERSRQERQTDRDRELIQDPEKLRKAMREVMVCSDNLPADEKTEARMVAHNLTFQRMLYLEWRERDLESREHGLVAKYNDLVADYNEVVTLATLALLHPTPTAPSSYPWLKPTAPIRGPVVCTGNTTALGQGMTNIYVKCN